MKVFVSFEVEVWAQETTRISVGSAVNKANKKFTNIKESKIALEI